MGELTLSGGLKSEGGEQTIKGDVIWQIRDREAYSWLRNS